MLDSALTELKARGPYYRGQAAVDLAEADTHFESVAELLWTGTLPDAPPRWDMEPLGALVWTLNQTCTTPAAHSVDSGEPLAAFRRGVTLLGSGRTACRAPAAAGMEAYRSARALLSFMSVLPAASAGPERLARARAIPGIAARLAFALGASGTAATRRRYAVLLNRALILCADHELDTSTFAARVAASAGVDLYACILSALITLHGTKHGGVCQVIEEMLASLREPGDIARYVAGRIGAGEAVPGFGHPLYPEGDPRARPLLTVARAMEADKAAVRSILALVAVMSQAGLPPTLELGLTALTEALELPKGSAYILLAIGRTAGLVGHVLEEWARDSVIRPRARYVGPEGGRTSVNSPTEERLRG
ncbi:citrate/2-methylcitrate synthase [Sorangium sp. So ce118]